MKLEGLDQCLLSTTPFVSLRTENQTTVIRLTTSPVYGNYHLLALVERNGIVGLWGGYVGEILKDSPISHGQLLDYLSRRIGEETGTVWKILSYSQDLLLSTYVDGETTTRIYVGTIPVAIAKTSNQAGVFQIDEFSIILTDIVDPQLINSIKAIAMELLPGQPHIVNPQQHDVDLALRTAARLTIRNAHLYATAVQQKYGLTVEEFCAKDPRAAYGELTALLAISPEIRRIDLGWSEAWIDHASRNKTFSTETDGNELRVRSGLEAAALLSYHTIFIVLPPTAIFVAPSFIKGLLKDSVIMEGGLVAFWNRYKFIGWEKFMTGLRATVTQIYNDHASKRKF